MIVNCLANLKDQIFANNFKPLNGFAGEINLMLQRLFMLLNNKPHQRSENVV